MSDLAIATTGLSKQYRGAVLAVDQIDLRVARDGPLPLTTESA